VADRDMPRTSRDLLEQVKIGLSMFESFGPSFYRRQNMPKFCGAATVDSTQLCFGRRHSVTVTSCPGILPGSRSIAAIEEFRAVPTHCSFRG